MAASKGGVRKVTLPSGTVKWEFCTWVELPDGKRKQVRRRFGTMAEADYEFRRTRNASADRKYVERWDGTVNAMLDDYLKSAAFEAKPATVISYRDALKPARERFGGRKARSITKQDIESLRDFMLTSGRRIGSKAGTALGPRSVRLTLLCLSAAWRQAIDHDNRLTYNPAAYVKAPRYRDGKEKAERKVWTEDQRSAYLAEASRDRLYAALALAVVAGMRRGEIVGLCWDQVYLADDGPYLEVVQEVVNNKTDYAHPHVLDTKSAMSDRIVVLDAHTAAALKSLKARQARERLKAGPAYEAGPDGGWLACNEIGARIYPDSLTDLHYKISAAAGLPRITLHDTRHTADTKLADYGIAGKDAESHTGHTAAVRKGYLHRTSEADDKIRAAMARAYGEAVS